MRPEMHAFHDLTASEYRALGDFHYQLRRFFHFSEQSAKEAGLEPRQHQIMLAIRASEGAHGPTVKELADRLLVRHHSAVGLIDRLVKQGLVERIKDGRDLRQVRLRLTARGAHLMNRLSDAHRDELRHAGPLLLAALSSLFDTATP